MRIVHLRMSIPKIRLRLCLLVFLVSCAVHSSSYAQESARMIISNGLVVLQSDTIRALQLFRTAVSEAQKTGNKQASAEAFVHCAETEKLLDSNSAAILDYKESAHLYGIAGMQQSAAQVYFALGQLQSDLALFDDALLSFEQSDNSLNDSLSSAHAANLVGAGMVLAKQGELVRAQQNFVNALELYELHSDSAGIADAWNGIGIVHWKEGRTDEALSAYQQSLEIRLRLHDSLSIAASYSNIGVICRLQNRVDEGLDYYLKSLGIRQRYKDRRGEAQVRFNIGSLLTDMDRNDEGLKYYNESYAIKKEIGDEYGLLPYYLNIAELYGTLGRINDQEKALLQGLSLADSLHSADYRKSFNRDLADFYSKKGDYEKAFRYHKKYTTIKDSLITREKNAELSRLQAAYDLKEKQRDIDKLESDQITFLENQEKEAMFRYVLIGAIILSLAFIVYIINRSIVLRKTNMELRASKLLVEKRDQEKEVLLREVHHRVKNNLQLTSSLLNLQAREVKDADSAQVLKEARDRIKAISLVHEELFSGSELSSINLAQYIPDLCNAVLGSNNTADKIDITYHLADIVVGIETTVSLGLMLNEILINSIKHAFAQNNSNCITVSLEKSRAGFYLVVRDNGRGIPREVTDGRKTGFGMKLLQSLAVKLHAQLGIRSDNGTIITIFVPTTDE